MKWQRLAFTLLIMIVISCIGSTTSYAFDPYTTYYRDQYDQLTKIQSAYNPIGVWGGEVYGTKALNLPKDIFSDNNDHLYISDTGNNRIVHLDDQGKLVRIIEAKDSPLSGPQGLFVDKEAHIYVADTGNKRVLKLDQEGKILHEFKRPDSIFIPDSFKFDPVNVVVDQRGFLYIVVLGGYQGLLTLDMEGKFQGFFGANLTTYSIIDTLKRLLYTDEMYQRELSKRPTSINNVTMDKDGFMYSVTTQAVKGQIKRYNIAGIDILKKTSEFLTEGEERSFGENAAWIKEPNSQQLNDLTVDSSGNMTAIDYAHHYVNQYDKNGNLLFFWGGESSTTSRKLGIVRNPTAITSNSKNELLILDSLNSLVHIYRLSEFGALVHQANELTQDGRYSESEPLWKQVHQLNQFYTPALIGMAKAAYARGDFVEASRLYLDAGHRVGYSDSFWQIRLRWFQENFGFLMNLVLIVGLVGFVWSKWFPNLRWKQGKWLLKIKNISLFKQLMHVFYLIKNPIDGFSAIRYEGKAGYISSIIILVSSLAAVCIMKVGTSFAFNANQVLEINLFPLVFQFLAIWLGWLISNYLISGLYKGEGRFRDIFCGSAYVLFPLVLIGIPLTILSNGMTLNEASIFGFLRLGMIVWTALLLFWKIQGIHNYSVGEAILNLILTVITMVVFAVMIFIIYSLTNELFAFLYSVYQEVVIR